MIFSILEVIGYRKSIFDNVSRTTLGINIKRIVSQVLTAFTEPRLKLTEAMFSYFSHTKTNATAYKPAREFNLCG